jgi:hypothetical protein
MISHPFGAGKFVPQNQKSYIDAGTGPALEKLGRRQVA